MEVGYKTMQSQELSLYAVIQAWALEKVEVNACMRSNSTDPVILRTITISTGGRSSHEMEAGEICRADEIVDGVSPSRGVAYKSLLSPSLA